MSVACAVAGVGVFTPQFGHWEAYVQGQPAEQPLIPSGALLDKHARRRASVLTKACADAYQQALEQAGFDAGMTGTLGAVFGSALGEADITLGLLEQLWRGPGGALSPMRFAASVHNAAAGVVSIGTKNQGFTTAMGADHDTPAMALTEGMAFVVTHDLPVIVVCGDEAAPANLVSGEEGWGFLTCAVALAPVHTANSRWPRITAPTRGVGMQHPSPSLPRELAQNPVVGLLDLIVALADVQRPEVRLDRGRGRGFGTHIIRAGS